ncbi:DUF397 domain-containing protein [Actinomadura madurae]|uniref:DUF397 domain-containing protein n=1 Tax=Actinomadura madurae TaxID=1993 RepID=UPI0009F87DDF
MPDECAQTKTPDPDPNINDLEWRRSCSNDSNCLEIASTPSGEILVRVSTNPSVVLRFTQATFSQFIKKIKTHTS